MTQSMYPENESPHLAPESSQKTETPPQVITAVASIAMPRFCPEMPDFAIDLPLDRRAEECLRVSELLFHGVTNWVDFYRMVFGVEGLINRLYPTSEDRLAFSLDPAYVQIQEQLNGLRERDTGKVEEVEAQRMITIRVPKSVHERLCAESNDLNVSVNTLCISKLIQFSDRLTVPKERGKRRGRRPGPQKRSPKVAAVAVEMDEAIEGSPE